MAGVVRSSAARASESAHTFKDALKRSRLRPGAAQRMAIVSHQHFKDRPLALQKICQYLGLENHCRKTMDAVQAVARQLEQESNPPPRPAAAVSPTTPVKPAKPARKPTASPPVAIAPKQKRRPPAPRAATAAPVRVGVALFPPPFNECRNL